MPKPKWSQWEEEVAYDTGGKLTPGSGNQWHTKSDVRTSTQRISCKETKADRFSVTRSDLREIQNIAAQDNKTAVMAINMNGIKFVVIPYHDFVEGAI